MPSESRSAATSDEDEYIAGLKSKLDAALKKSRSFQNSTGVIMTNALNAALNMHIAYCQMGEHAGRAYLIKAMHSALIIAEQCRQEMSGTAP